MARIIQTRRGTAAQWTSANPILASGEKGFETDTKKFKWGDGTTAWNSLPYSIDSTAIHTDVASEIFGVTAKTTPTVSDYLLIEDAAAGNAKKRITIQKIIDLSPGGFTDPMTTRGDIIVRDAANTTARLGIGTSGYVLTSNGTDVAWAAAAAASPLTTKGDLYTFTTVNARLPVGTNGYVLSANSATATGLEWIVAPVGFTDPMTTRGDIIYRNASNITDRLAAGAAGFVLTSDATDISRAAGAASGGGISFAWKFDTGTTQPGLAAGDIRFDNATPASVTSLFVSETSDNGVDLSTLLSLIASGYKIYIQQEDNSAKFLLATVSGATTDNGTDWTIPVTINSYGTLPDNNKVCRIIITAAAATAYTDEQAQDAVGNILVDSATVDFTYNDGANTITAVVLSGGLTGASIPFAFTAGSVVFSNGTTLAQDNATFFWDSTNKRLGLGVGAASNTLTINGTTYGAVSTVGADGTGDVLLSALHRHSSTAAIGAYSVHARSRGASGAETVVQNGDVLGAVYFVGHDGTDYANGAAIIASVSGAPGANDMPTQLVFQTSPDGSQTLTTAMTISPAQVVTFANTISGNISGNAATVTTNANLTGEVTSTGNAAIVDKTAITNKTTVTGVSGDFVLISDTSDSGNLKKVDLVDLLGGGASDHAALSNLSWTLSGHVGTATRLAGFDGSNVASLYTLSGTGTEVALTTSPTFVTPALGTPSSGNLSNCSAYPSSAIDHDLTTNFVADEHIAHSGVSINTAANSGLAGGGTIAASRSLTLDINNLSSVTPVLGDSFGFYDLSGAVTGKATLTTLNSILNFASLTDVTITSAANGDTLRYSTATSEWVNSTRLKVTDQVSIEPATPSGSFPYSIVADHAGTNLVVNPSFENNITDGWSNTGTSTNTRDTTEKWIGSASLKIVSSAADAGVVSSAITVTPNTQYVFSVYVKGSVGSEQVYLTIDPNVGANVNSTNQTGGFDLYSIEDLVTTEWSRIQLPWTSGASDTSVQLYIRSDTATAQTVYIDAVQFEAKTWPTDSEEVVFASSYMDGSMGDGYAWTGTAHNSTSTRTAGTKFLAPISSSNNRGNFILRTDGTIARAMFDAKEVQSADISGTRNEPFYPFTFTGKMRTNVLTSGISAGIVNIRNTVDGTALNVESSATTSASMIVSAGSLTSGVGMAIYAPADLTAMQAAGGTFFKFAGKAANSDMYTWKVDTVQFGAIGFNFEKNMFLIGGGSMTTTARSLSGTLSVTASSTTVTGTGTAFLTDFRRGQAIRINNGASSIIHTIASIASNTSLTLTAGWTGTTNASRSYDSFTTQYRPPTIGLEGNYANHGSSGSTSGDFIYSIYASGGGGHLHVLRSTNRGTPTTPTADNAGHGIVTSRLITNSDKTIFLSSSETDMVTGYTIPAHELLNGTVLRIKFTASMTANATTTTTTWRVKLGGTTILTSTAHRAESTASGLICKGEIEIVGVTETTQRVSLSFAGKDPATVTGGDTFSYYNYGTSSIDMRVDRALLVTAQMSDASSALITSFSTVEIL